MEDKELRQLASYILGSEKKDYMAIFSKLTTEEEKRLIPFLEAEAAKNRREAAKRLRDIKEDIQIEKARLYRLVTETKADIARTKRQIKETMVLARKAERELEAERAKTARREYLGLVGEA